EHSPAADQRPPALGRGPARPGPAAAHGPRAARGGYGVAGGPARGPRPRRRSPGPRQGARPDAAAADDRYDVAGADDPHRGWLVGRRDRLGLRRLPAQHRRSGGDRGPDPAGDRPARQPHRRRPRGARDPVRRGERRRRHLHREDRWSPARPDVQGVRAPQVPRPAPRSRLHPRAAAAGGVGLRL
ncbi:MAG: GlnR-family transcriptional regulator, partial [uncultured Nocardioidaceae bacterium]